MNFDTRVDVRSYHAEVRQQMEAIADPYPFVTSRAVALRRMPGGVTSQVDRETAARLLVEQTHTLATEEEVERYHAQCAEQRQRIQETEQRLMSYRMFLPTAAPMATPVKKKEKE
ncbi:MAG: hypothetical protein K2X35_09600 [Bryobacteraceae bacterium]|nr:hypothetical protein [Bryobacteraceae bacterium]